MRYMVAHVINSPSGAVRTARLVIDNVPDKTTRADVIEALTKHGDAARFSEAGIPFGNHEVVAEGRQGWPKGVGAIADAKLTTWAKLTESPLNGDLKRVTVRLSPAGFAAVQLAAQREAGGNLQRWTERVLLTAAGAPETAYLPEPRKTADAHSDGAR